jgi:hypothetical protein
MLLPAIIGLGLISLFKGPAKKAPNYGMMTAERNHLYTSALRSTVMSADQYTTLAKAFEENGLPAEALLLRKRAALRAMPESARAERKAAIRKALASSDPDMIEKIASICEQQGASGSAKTLRIHAIGVRNKAKVQPVTVAPAPSPAATQAQEGSTDPTHDSDSPTGATNASVQLVDDDDDDVNDAGERPMTEAELTNPNLQ